MGLGPNDAWTVTKAAADNGPWAVIGLILGVLWIGSTVKMTQVPTLTGISLTYYSDVWVDRASNPAALLPSFIVAAAVGAFAGYLAGGVIKTLWALWSE